MADARAMALPLVTTGDTDYVEHDWNTIFTSLGVLQYDTAIAAVVRFLGWCGMIGLVVWLTWQSTRERSFQAERAKLAAKVTPRITDPARQTELQHKLLLVFLCVSVSLW
jgi:hypothetical protein